MAKHTLREAFIFNGTVYGPGEAELPKEAEDALKAKGAFGDAPTTQEAALAGARAAAVDVSPEAQQAGEQAAAQSRQEVAAQAAEQARQNAAALKRAVKASR